MGLTAEQEKAAQFLNNRLWALQKEFEELPKFLKSLFRESNRDIMTVYKEKYENLCSETDDEDQEKGWKSCSKSNLVSRVLCCSITYA